MYCDKKGNIFSQFFSNIMPIIMTLKRHDKSLCHQPKFAATGHTNNLLTKYTNYFCVMEDTTASTLGSKVKTSKLPKESRRVKQGQIFYNKNLNLKKFLNQ